MKLKNSLMQLGAMVGVFIVIGLFGVKIGCAIVMGVCACVMGYALYKSEKNGVKTMATVTEVTGMSAKLAYECGGEQLEAPLSLTAKEAKALKEGDSLEIICYPDAPGRVGRESSLNTLKLILCILVASIPVFLFMKL